MLFCGVYQSEQIDLHQEDNLDEVWSVLLTIDKHEPKFYVCGDDEENEWCWEFWYASKTAYERVKWCIMDVACEVETMSELMQSLNEIFYECFDDLLVEEIKYEDCNSLLN